MKIYDEVIDLYKFFEKSHCLNGNSAGGGNSLKLRTCKNALVLPYKYEDGIVKGGISCGYKFIYGVPHWRSEINDKKRFYKVDEKSVTYYDEKVIFGGTLFIHFGHFILETLSWLWFLAKYPDLRKQKIIFLCNEINPQIPDWLYEFFNILEINPENIQIISEPAIFKEIMTGGSSFLLDEGFYKEYEELISYIKNKIPDADIGKVYLTRTNLKKESQGLGEDYFEDFYKKQGYKIIGPERLKVIEQLTIWKNAKDIACTEGTLAHAAIFSATNANITILKRMRSIVLVQAFINEIANLNCTYVNVVHSFLPDNHWVHNKYIIGPTKYWKEFLLNSSYSYTGKDFEFDISPYVVDYIKSWAEKYPKKDAFELIKNMSSQDYVNYIASELCGNNFKPLEYYNKINVVDDCKFLYQRFKFVFEIYYGINRFAKNITWGRLKAKTVENSRFIKEFLKFVK